MQALAQHSILVHPSSTMYDHNDVWLCSSRSYSTLEPVRVASPTFLRIAENSQQPDFTSAISSLHCISIDRLRHLDLQDASDTSRRDRLVPRLDDHGASPAALVRKTLLLGPRWAAHRVRGGFGNIDHLESPLYVSFPLNESPKMTTGYGWKD